MKSPHRWQRWVLGATASLLGTACGNATNPSQGADSLAGHSHHLHMQPYGQTASPASLSTAANQLNYYGGPVISNVAVVDVNWNGSVASATMSGMPGFYQAVVGSELMDWMTEYNTNINANAGAHNGLAGTNQSIGHGTYVGAYTLSKSAGSITDADIQSAISSAISAGQLPSPNTNTIYMMHFPPGTSIAGAGSNSCVSGGFCAYHSTMSYSGLDVKYGVMPDMSSDCAVGCGNASNYFDNGTSVASHELIEAVTDANVGYLPASSPSYDYPCAWGGSGGEIGDLCNGQQGPIAATKPDGTHYIVQKEYDNATGNCIVSKSTPPPPPPPGVLTNGTFETGSLSPWTTAGTTSVSTSAHSGSYAAMVGSTSPTNGDSSISQTFTSSTATTLSFFYKVVCPDTVTYDWATATLKDNTAGTTTTMVAKTCSNSGAWQSASASIVANHSYTLTLVSHDDNYSGDPTYTLYDDVTLGGGSPPPPPPPNPIVNGGFEAGSLSGWTASGAATAAVTGSAHTGSYSAQLGSTSPTNGDSSIAQTFTAPSGSSKVSFFYKVVCPDTVTYDWATATLRDNTAGTTATVLAKTCSNSGSWSSASGSLTAGHSYTLTLTSHDDNYSGDATYTYFDDVTVQ